MNELDMPNLGKELTLDPQNLTFHSGDKSFSKDEFIKIFSPYFEEAKKVGRTNYLCAFKYGNGDKTDVTAYRTDTTINVTNNSKVLKSKSTNGTWVVYELKS